MQQITNMFSIYLTSEYIKTRDLRDCLGISDTEENNLIESVVYNPLLLPVFGALNSCHTLKDMGFDLYILTARQDKVITKDWLDKHMFSPLITDIYYTNLDLSINIPREFDFMLDDSPKKLVNYQGVVTRAKCLYDRPQNRGCLDVHRQFTRVKNWDHFLMVVKERLIGDTKS